MNNKTKKFAAILFFLSGIITTNAQVADKITVIGADITANPAPSAFSQEVRFHFKWNSSIGVPHIGSPGPGTYSALMTIAPWSDGTASKHHQLNFNEDGLFWRKGTFGSSWESWKRIVVAEANGNVGIGTTNPGAFKLAVEGKIGAREVNVTTTTPWPDYVFEEDYFLPNLEEVEDYIRQYKHLPEVPTAKEIEQNGANLGETNILLLKKVEELTLYVIELKKENEKQNRMIEQIRSQK